MADLTNPVDQLSNADLAAWCRARADESGEHPIARMTFRSIAARLERPAVEGVVFEVGYAEMWGVEVQIEQERLAEILGVDPKVRMPVKVTITPAGEDGG